MDAILLPLIVLGGLVALGWLAAWGGVDSRDWPLSEEERLAQHGYTWGEPALARQPLIGYAAYRQVDLQREAAAERLAYAARLARVEASVRRPGILRGARARVAAGLVHLAARVDRAAALDGAANQLQRLPNC
jgi:hypothetical protein